EAHDVIDVREWVLVVLVQPQIVRNGYSFGNDPAELFGVPTFQALRRGKVIRHHAVPRIPNTRESVQFSKLLVAESIAIFSERRVSPDLVVRSVQSEASDTILLLT